MLWKDLHNSLISRCSKDKCFLVRYEDLRSDITKELKPVLEFLNVNSTNLASCVESASSKQFKRQSMPLKKLKKIHQILDKTIGNEKKTYEMYTQKFIEKLSK